MRRMVALAVVMVCSICSLSGCMWGDDAYCGAVKKHRSVLDTFGKTRTNAAFSTYATAASDIEKVAPERIRPTWRTIAAATRGVLTAQKTAGITLEQSSDTTVTAKLTTAQRAALNRAYSTFNATSESRVKAVKDVGRHCGVSLATAK